MDYWVYIGKLGIYVAVSLIIGLLLAIPFRKLNQMIETGKEKTEIMI
jgi:putative membrane protein